MRSQLKTKVGVRKIFTGVFEQYGFVRNEEGTVISTMLLCDVKAKGTVVTDHVWVEVTDKVREAGSFAKGEKILFSARVIPYTKDNGKWSDIGLTTLTKVRRCAFND